MTRQRYGLVLLSVVLLLASAGDRAGAKGLAERVIEHKLANGLTVLMVERHQTPVVSINLTFKVGGMNEYTGITGVAHLYEHMAFKGTRALGTKDYERERPLLEELARINETIEELRGSSRNASTTESSEIKELRRAFEETQKKAGALVVGNEMSLLYQRQGRSV